MRSKKSCEKSDDHELRLRRRTQSVAVSRGSAVNVDFPNV